MVEKKAGESPWTVGGLDKRTPVGSPACARMGRAGPEGGLPVIPSPRGSGMECFGVLGGWGQSSERARRGAQTKQGRVPTGVVGTCVMRAGVSQAAYASIA